MRMLFAVLTALTLLVYTGHAQEVVIFTNSLPRTDIEAFEAQTNTVIVKGMSLINSINMSGGSISVHSKESIDVTTGRKQYGMMLEFTANEWRSRAVVDYSELDSMLEGIDYLNKVTSDVTPLTSFDAVYTTKSGFRVIAYSSRRQGAVRIFIQFEDGPRVPLTSDQVSQFRDLVGSVKNSLDGMQGAR